jgi:hypothetical protein
MIRFKSFTVPLTSMQESVYAVVLIAALCVAGITTAVSYPQVSADPDIKEKTWGNDQIGVGAMCEKSDGGCKEFKDANGANVNKLAREDCESNGQKCKQIK